MNTALNYSQDLLDHYLSGFDVDNFKGKGKAKRAAKKTAKAPKKAARKEKVNTFKEKVKDTVKKIGSAGVLVPFKPVMVNQLNRLGEKVTLKTPIDEVATLFFNRVVQKKEKNYDANFAVSAEIMAGIVQGVLGFFKALFKKKKDGETLSPAENTMLEGAEKVSNALDEAQTDYTEESIGELVMQYLPWAIGVGVLIWLIKK